MNKFLIVKYKNIYSVLKYIYHGNSVGYMKLFESTSKKECSEFIEGVKNEWTLFNTWNSWNK